MKKIIMAVAAIAMVASMFAADVSAGTQIDGTLFNFSNKTISVLKAQNGSQDYAMPNFAFAISDDRAGGELKITTQANDTPKLTTQKIWFKPLDMLKITVGNWGSNLNQETIGWSNTESGNGNGYGYAVSLNIEGFGADVAFLPGSGAYWLGIPTAGGDATINEMYLKAGYSADFGTINGMFDLATKNKKDQMRFGVGYKGSFAPVNTLFVNAIGYMNGDFAGIRGEVFADVGLDGGIGIKAFVPVTFVMKGQKMFAVEAWHNGAVHNEWGDVPADNSLILGTILRFSFPVGSMGAYVQVEDTNWLAKTFELKVIPGISGSVGLMGWEVKLEVTMKKPETGDFDLGINIPATFKVSF